MSPYQNQSLEDQRKDADELLGTINAHTPPEVLERMRNRIREMGLDGGSPTLSGSSVFTREKSISTRPRANDEIAQLKQLQKACVESEELAVAIAGLRGNVRLDLVKIPPFTREIGHLIQVFNRMIEDHWESGEKPRLRKVIYTKKDLDNV
jgi:hypothetical protein